MQNYQYIVVSQGGKGWWSGACRNPTLEIDITLQLVDEIIVLILIDFFFVLYDATSQHPLTRDTQKEILQTVQPIPKLE